MEDLNKEDKSAPEAQKGPQTRKVALETTLDGKTEVEQVRFNTAILLARVEKLDDKAEVRITVAPPDGSEPVVLAEGPKADVAAALRASTIPPDKLAAHIQEFVRFLVDHSTLRAIGVEAVCATEDGSDAGFGFVSTTVDCTKAEAVALVNCGDANMDEFVSKAGLEVPGRSPGGEKGKIIVPTPEQVRKLG